MSEVQLSTEKTALMWEDSKQLEEVRRLFAPTLSETEFQIFVGMGKATGLNPFTREIWAVKYDKNAAQIFIGRDGYRKAAQAHPEYDYHQCDAVYENDTFHVKNGEVEHEYKLTNRGNLVGAYCVAKRHKSSRPIYVFAEFREYSTGRSTWKQIPATMIKKVAESQCLRACFQDLLGGTYGAEEMERAESKAEEKVINVEEFKKEIKTTLQHDEMIRDRQHETICDLMTQHNFDDDRQKRALDYYRATNITDLTAKQADDLIGKLNKLKAG